MKGRARRALPRGPEASRARIALAERLRGRYADIEEAIVTRVNAIADPDEAPDPSYRAGLRIAVAAAIEYGLEAVRSGDRATTPVPVPLLSQARLAARNGVSLDTVLRRYVAGYSLLGDFLVEEAALAEDVSVGALKSLLAAQSAGLDRLILAVSGEFAREEKVRRAAAAGERRVERVRALLAGEPVDGEIAYEFDGWHHGLALAGEPDAVAMRELADSLDRRLLLVEPDRQRTWAWLGGRKPVESEEVLRAVDEHLPARTVAIGEPGQGLAGWRLTHRQAIGALGVAIRHGHSSARYAEVALLAAALDDDLFSASVRSLYLAPLERERDGGEVSRETLRAYFASGRNVSSAAAALGVSRHTVANRLNAIEKRLCRPLISCALELEVALHLAELEVRPELH